MTIRILLRAFAAAFAVSLGVAAQAQSWTVGDQGANWSSIPTSYPTGSAPADAYEPAEIPPTGFTASDWYTTGDFLGTSFIVTGDNSREKKLRFQCESVGILLNQDFILRPVKSHLHAPFGFFNWTELSSYANARANPSSSCMGGPLFTQGYIEPAGKSVYKGRIVVRRPQNQTIYYINGDQSQANDKTWLRRDMAYIIGPNPMNYNDQARRDIYAAAGFDYPGSPVSPAGFGGIQCFNGPSQTDIVTVTLDKAKFQSPKGIKSSTEALYAWGPGEDDDPWGGNCVGYSDSVPAILIANLVGPGCWDGYNLRSPDGRGHVWWWATRPDGSDKDSCPKTTSGDPYRKLPEPTFKTAYAVSGPADYKNLWVSSDRMNPPDTPADPTSLSQCRSVGPNFCNLETIHADWNFSADSATFEEGERECLGIPVRGIAPEYSSGAECNAGTLSRYKELKFGVSPDPSLSAGCTVILSCYDSIPSKPKELYESLPATDGSGGPSRVISGKMEGM